MCLIVFAWRPEHSQPLILAANRDEFYARPTLPLAQWEHYPDVYAGRDLEAGGTWLGINANARFAALTNIRDPERPSGMRSRGELVADFLTGAMPIERYLGEVAEHSRAYGGFNLLLGDGQALYYMNAAQAAPRRLAPGIYGISNAALDTPWPKLLKAKAALADALSEPSPETLIESLFECLADAQAADDTQLPNTGVSPVMEKLLSSVFIASAEYGTRASTVLIVNADGSRRLIERSFGPYGGRLGETQIKL